MTFWSRTRLLLGCSLCTRNLPWAISSQTLWTLFTPGHPSSAEGPYWAFGTLPIQNPEPVAEYTRTIADVSSPKVANLAGAALFTPVSSIRALINVARNAELTLAFRSRCARRFFRTGRRADEPRTEASATERRPRRSCEPCTVIGSYPAQKVLLRGHLHIYYRDVSPAVFSEGNQPQKYWALESIISEDGPPAVAKARVHTDRQGMEFQFVRSEMFPLSQNELSC